MVNHRELSVTLAHALNTREATIRRDECGDWAIFGAHGHIYSLPGASYAYVRCRSSTAWTYAKKKMKFCRVTQDGDDEGIFRFVRFPDYEQAEVIREVVGLPKRRSPDAASHLKAHQFRVQE